MKKINKGDTLFNIINTLILGLILVIVIYPLYFIVIASISDPTLVNSGKVLLIPKGITFEGYKLVFGNKDLWVGYRNTILYTILGSGLGTILTMMIAYPLAIKSFKGRKVLMLFLMITMYFNGGLIPTYLLVQDLHLYNTPVVMVLLGVVSVFNIILARTFLSSTVSEELYEAAVMDGCSHIRYFVQIVMPLSKAILAVLALYYGVAIWNEFFKGLIYLQDKNLYPLQLFLRSILVENTVSEEELVFVEEVVKQQRLVELMKYGLIIVSSVPILMVYPFLQKYFVKGVMIGSVKG